LKIPLSYSYRNLVTRRLTTALTAGGMALVVFVFAAVLMLAEGLRQTLVTCLVIAIIIGALSAIFPAWRAARVPIAEGVRRIG
jgi:ABC-type lipoprotein release transport system permease subunit